MKTETITQVLVMALKSFKKFLMRILWSKRSKQYLNKGSKKSTLIKDLKKCLNQGSKRNTLIKGLKIALIKDLKSALIKDLKSTLIKSLKIALIKHLKEKYLNKGSKRVP